MTIELILRTLFSFLPFLACLVWAIAFLTEIRSADISKRYYLVYITTCVILYFCHAVYFTLGLPYGMECLWSFCSLSVYPLFYAYLSRLTTNDFTAKKLVPLLIPGLVVSIAKYILPESNIDTIRIILFSVQLILVCIYGLRKLNEFDKKIKTVYADTERRDTTSVKNLFIAIIIVSIVAALANSIGKKFFGESLYLLIPISLAFTTMLSILSFMCYNRKFTIDDLLQDDNDEEEPGVKDMGKTYDTNIIGKKLEELMVKRQYYLNKDLKIGDIAKEIGSNRTYVSNYINRTHNCSFSDYTNNLRIEYAKKLLESSSNMKITQIAESSGYSSEQSFFRNFKKFTNKTPIEWLNIRKNTQN